MYRVIELRPLSGYFLRLYFENGTAKTVDLEPFIGKGASAPLLDHDYFQQVEIDSAGGIVWPNGCDFCPEFLYDDVPAVIDDSLRGERARRLVGGGRRFSPERDSVAELIVERELDDPSIEV